MGKISIVINTLNEEKNLPQAISSVRRIADEIVVVDMYSDDGTAAVARKMGAKVFEHKRTGYVEPARNFAIEKATGDWILILDADEEIPESLAAKLKNIADSDNALDYYAIPRKNYCFGKWMRYSRSWPDYNIRFFKKGNVAWGDEIHSVPVTQGKGGDLEATSENAITHYNYTSVEQFVDRLNRYTTHQVSVIGKTGYKFYWPDLLHKPLSEFVSRYFYGMGYKDGVHGLALSLLQAFSELVLYLKIWQTEKFEKKELSLKRVSHELKKSQKEMNYWLATAFLKEKDSLLQRIKRKYRLL